MAQKLTTSMQSLSLDENYVISAAIDFGTTFSGYAFSFKSSPKDIKMNKNWGAQLGCDSYKAPTCVMTNPDGSFHSFGYEAENEYSQLDPEDDEIGGPTGFNLYRHFKMMLHDQVVNLSSTLVSTTGHVTKAIDIFTMALKYLHEHMMEPIKAALESSPKNSDIRWVLTVPAIWRDEAKGFMREAAYRAGLITEKNSRKLLIALEPEAASIFCRSLEINSFASSENLQKEDLSFKFGQNIIIIDAGGGTVDITAHKIILDGQVKEITPPSGGLWGGSKVDEKFITLLAKIFGTDFINSFKAKQPQQWLQFMTTFERSKRAVLPNSKSSIKVPLPYSLEKELKKIKHMDIEEIVAKLPNKKVTLSNGFIIVKHDKANDLFTENISNIIDHVKALLSNAHMKGMDYILLVGGFGECKLLQKACQQHLGSIAKILIPVEAQLAIIKGAVMFGHNPMQVKSRIARCTYGEHSLLPFKEGKHDPTKKKFADGIDWCNDCFDIYIRKGEEIVTGETKIFRSKPLNKEQITAKHTFYKTDREIVTYTDDPGVQKLATATLRSSNGPLGKDLERRITFGHTEILVEARDVSAGSDFPVKLTLDFLAD